MTDRRRFEDTGLFAWIRDARVQAVLDVLLVALLVWAAWSSWQINDTANDARETASALSAEVAARGQASYQNCQAANDSRRALKGLLRAAEAAIIRSPHTPGRQKAMAVRFYERQQAKIVLSDCSAFRPPAKGRHP